MVRRHLKEPQLIEARALAPLQAQRVVPGREALGERQEVHPEFLRLVFLPVRGEDPTQEPLVAVGIRQIGKTIEIIVKPIITMRPDLARGNAVD